MDSYERWKEMGQPVDLLMECWLRSRSSDTVVCGEHAWADREPADDAYDNPERTWACILYAVRDKRFEPHLGYLAAGALEDLLSFHGPTFIERVEHEARTDPTFARMLGGVWKFMMSDEIWDRVQAVWDTRDGKGPSEAYGNGGPGPPPDGC